MTKKVLALYVPVLHQGYINFFEKWRYSVETVYVFGQDIIGDLIYLEREIRAMDPCLVASLISALGFFKEVMVLDRAKLELLRGQSIITADESISRRLAEQYLSGYQVQYDNVFLRWDERYVASAEVVVYDRVSSDPFDRRMMKLATAEGERSSDWWRKIGAVLVSGQEVLLKTHNTHLPSEHSPYIDGDIRDFIKPGEQSDISSSVHAEKLIIATAARECIALKGTSIYVSVFPCSGCAQMVVLSGISKCFYGGGCANFNGQKLLKLFGVELIYVE